MSWGQFRSIENGIMHITPETWAPGIWAGTENAEITYRLDPAGPSYWARVVSIDLDNRTITLSTQASMYGLGNIETINGTPYGGMFNIDPTTYNTWISRDSISSGAALTLDSINRARESVERMGHQYEQDRREHDEHLRIQADLVGRWINPGDLIVYKDKEPKKKVVKNKPYREDK